MAAFGRLVDVQRQIFNRLTTNVSFSQKRSFRLTANEEIEGLFSATSGRSHNLFYDQRSTKSIETRVDQYTEGTLNIDVVNAPTKKLVWEGPVAGRLTEKDVHNMKQTVDEVVAAVINNFPIDAVIEIIHKLQSHLRR